MQSRPEPKRICGRIGLALFAMLVVWNAGAIALQWLVVSLAPWLLYSSWCLWLLSSGPLFLLGLPVFLLILRTLPDGPTILRWKLPFGVREYILAMVFCLGASHLINLISTLTLGFFLGLFDGGDFAINPAQQLVAGGSFLPTMVFGVLVPAFGEEFIFRYIIRRKMRGCPDSTYLFFSGFCFALFHGNLSQGLYTFLVGIIFAWAYVMTGKFLVPVSMHFLLNLVGTAPSFAPESRAVLILFGLFVLGCIISGIIIFFACKRSFFASLQPPAEAGWPHKPARPRPFGSSTYAAQYTAACTGAGYTGASSMPPALPPAYISTTAPVYALPAPTPYFQMPYYLPPKTPHPFRVIFCTVGMWLFIGASLVLFVFNQLMMVFL